MKDPYKTLGLDRSASQDDIKRAFRKLTRKHHPDLNPDNPKAAEIFSEISAAHDLLADPEQRRRFDAGEIDASGAEQPRQHFYRDFAGASGAGPDAGFQRGAAGGFSGGDAEDLESFFTRAFGGGGGPFGGAFGGGFGGGRGVRARGADAAYKLDIGFLEAANGAIQTITLPEGKTLRVRIPEGAEDGQTLRLKGQGGAGMGGGDAGDALVELRVKPHPFFERKGDDIHVAVPVTLKEAGLGAKIEVPTIAGPVTLSVPKGSSTGKVLRLRDKGIRNRKTGTRGHQYVRLHVTLPETEDPELSAFLERWEPKQPQDPRKAML